MSRRRILISRLLSCCSYGRRPERAKGSLFVIVARLPWASLKQMHSGVAIRSARIPDRREGYARGGGENR
jgi:hypothetical protein